MPWIFYGNSSLLLFLPDEWENYFSIDKGVSLLYKGSDFYFIVLKTPNPLFTNHTKRLYRRFPPVRNRPP